MRRHSDALLTYNFVLSQFGIENADSDKRGIRWACGEQAEAKSLSVIELQVSPSTGTYKRVRKK